MKKTKGLTYKTKKKKTGVMGYIRHVLLYVACYFCFISAILSLLCIVLMISPNMSVISKWQQNNSLQGLPLYQYMSKMSTIINQYVTIPVML